MPHSLRKSFTAWPQLPALPPTPRKNSRPSRARSAASSVASFSMATRSSWLPTFPTSWKYVWANIERHYNGPRLKLIPVILCGGSGTRLWPLSRSYLPKQFLPLVTTPTMLQETLLRLRGLENLGAPIAVANEEHRFLAAEQ